MNSVEYETLEAQWTPFLKKFAGWAIPGMDSEDIMQEMRIVLFKCQRKYEADPEKHTKFITLLYGSCLNIMLNLLRDSGGGSKPYMKYVPTNKPFPLCEGEHPNDGQCENSWCTAPGSRLFRQPVQPSGLAWSDLLKGASDDARWLADFAIKGRWSKADAEKILGEERVKNGLKELRVVIKGGLS